MEIGKTDTCNGLGSVLQLSNDDSTSITKLEGREGKEEKMTNAFALVSVCPDGDYG